MPLAITLVAMQIRRVAIIILIIIIEKDMPLVTKIIHKNK